MNKKGYLRTVEAIIALVIVLTVVFSAMPKGIKVESSVPYLVRTSQEVIKEKISLDNELKLCLTSEKPGCPDSAMGKVSDIIEKNQPRGYNYAFKLCNNPTCLCLETDSDCKAPTETGVKYPDQASSNVYMADIFISSVGSGDEKGHQILRFWIWRAE